MTPHEITELQHALGLSDGKIASALGVTRQTWRNWRTGRPCPPFAQNALLWMMELRRIDPANDNLPNRVRVILTSVACMLLIGDDLCLQASVA